MGRKELERLVRNDVLESYDYGLDALVSAVRLPGVVVAAIIKERGRRAECALVDARVGRRSLPNVRGLVEGVSEEAISDVVSRRKARYSIE